MLFSLAFLFLLLLVLLVDFLRLQLDPGLQVMMLFSLAFLFLLLLVLLLGSLKATNSSSNAFLYSGSAIWILVKNEEMQERGSTSSCLASSSRYCVHIH